MRKMKIIMLTLLMVLIVAAQAAAAVPEKIVLEKNHSTYLDLWGMDSVAIANPEIADIAVVSGREILIIAKQQGSTSLQVKFKSGNRKEYAVIVTDSDKAMAESIEDMINYPNVTVSKVGDNIVLDGSVDNQIEKKRAETIAGMYAQKVMNLLEMENPKQIKIEAKVVEISSNDADKFGFQYFNASSVKLDKDSNFTTVTEGTPGSFAMGQNYGKGAYGWFGDYATIDASLTALISNGKAKLLSQPNMVTMSGEKANILIGGEIPIPISNSDGQISVEWREYGIRLDIEPNADSADQIASKVQAEVSLLDTTTSVAINTNGFSVPGLRSRKAETMITLKSGSTMAIGGLISSEDSKSISKLPILGDLPVLGQFFRYTSKSKDRREIIILITPTLVDAETKTLMSHKMKSYISDKAEEEKKLAKSPEELKKETAKAKEAKKKAAAEEMKAKADAEAKQIAENKAREDAEKLKKEQEKESADKAKAAAEKAKADKIAAEKLAKEKATSEAQKSAREEKNTAGTKGKSAADATRVKATTTARATVNIKPAKEQAPPPLAKKAELGDVIVTAESADKKPQKAAR